MDTSLNREARGQNRGFEDTVAMVKSELTQDGKSLNLNAAYLKEYGAKDIANMDFLEGLSNLELGTNIIGPRGAKYLGQSKYLVNLTSLNLYYNNLGDEGVKYIAISDNLLSLTNLKLSDNDIGDEGAKYLAKFLPLFTKLVRLDLRLNRIHEEGKTALREAQKLTNLKQLLLDEDY
ncbi:MAG: hypothetical protein GWM98_14885 [Nitrospinaceae bacterium]|nr:hypothetical protein [Nitrospinaceae bacterium]NIR55526.1 hypothetical protein [Nitrospinaceae bacterium]NIS85960.1 hypothetical protein [Nitrospinaceae bacterium]NIT82806.1 hypothetical protein [Nitrospinaceae bacterium]NIU45008.1 hypothetical protein [Nitrospinaceae bacterium]